MIGTLKKLTGKYLRSWDGPMTSRLKLDQASYGLGMVPASVKPDAVTSMVCGYCSTGCSLKVHLKQGEAVNMSADYHYPVNRGMACPKGWLGLDVLKAADRAVSPLIRNGGEFHDISWHEALSVFCERFKAIQTQHGNASLAFLSTGQIVSEEMAFLGALAKFGMGMIHGDGNTRQCMATAVTAYKESFGFDAPPYTYKDFEESDVLVFVGANPCIAHPIMWKRVLDNPHRPKIIVVDPRRTETAAAATLHAALKPKSDLILFYGIAHRLITRGYTDEKFILENTNGMDEFREFVAQYEEEAVLKATGLTTETFEEMVEQIGRGKRVSFWWTMGVNQSYEGTRVAQSLINLALITGNIGRPGTGANSITGQCNAMGSRLFSNTTNLLGGHDFRRSEDRQKIARTLGIDAGRIPSVPSKSYHEILDAIEAGEIRGLWVIATNTAHSWINSGKFKKLREKLDFLVVQDMYHSTETAAMADLFLPAAGWGEKEGTFINSERRIGRVKKVRKAPGQALADFHIFRLIVDSWGCGEMFSRWNSPESVFNIMQELSKDQPCDITGISGYNMLEETGGVQWPFPSGFSTLEKERRLFSDGKFYHRDKKARIIFEAPRGLPEATNDEYPFVLLTGRGTSSQWHTQTRTGKSELLKKLYPGNNYAEIHPEDARRLKITSGSEVRVCSRRGAIVVRALITTTVTKGQIFIPMHYDTTNRLTMESFDPYSRQPSYKYAAVDLQPC